jgi:organic hydroperoxide reductase OsmC/OhrA
MPTRGSISKRGKGPIRAEAEPDVTATHAPIQISRGAGVTLVVASLLGLAFVGWQGPKATFHLTADGKDRETIERVLDVYADGCPVARSIGGSIEITSELDLSTR